MENQEIIAFRNVSKKFKLPHERKNTFKEYLFSLGEIGTYEELWALRDVSFSIKKGEFVSFIGSNGSGKTTLLRLISKVYRPTSGIISVNGVTAPFLDLGIGFQGDLTVKDNIYLYGAIFGLTRNKINKLFVKIIDFSGLGQYIDQKVKNLSTGMEVRLAFSIAVHTDADILLVDEVLAVGDLAFQKKCLETFEQFKAENKTIIFVSHNFDIVRQFSDRVGWIDGGRLKKFDYSDLVIGQYQESFNKNGR